MKSNLLETIVGGIVLLLTVVFVIYGYSVTDTNSENGYLLHAEFDRIDGLNLGGDVRISGIKVGHIVGQSLDKETYRAEIAMLINHDIILPDDTSAKITTEGILGKYYISLVLGGSEEMLSEGDDIMYTQGTIDLITLVSQALFATGDHASE